MNSILIVTEQFTTGGLETHICGEVLQLSRRGIKVHLAVGKAFDDSLLPPCVSSISHSLPFSLAATPDELLKAINDLQNIIREQSISHIHIHPFASMIPAVVAAELESVPYAITLHGPASCASYGPIYDFLLKDLVLSSAGLVVAISPEVKRLISLNANSESVALIPNAVSFTDNSTSANCLSDIDLRWLLVSRLDQFKIKGIVDFCIKARDAALPGVIIVGDGPAKDNLIQELKRHELASYTELLGSSTEVLSLIQTTSGVAGMGRVVLEGLASRKPVVLVGYDGVKGVVDKALLLNAADSNFSGRGLPTISSAELSEQLLKKATSKNTLVVYDCAKSKFNDLNNWSQFIDRLASTPRSAPSILSGLYYSLCADPVCDGTPYINNFEILDRLESIVYSKNCYDARLVAAMSLCRQRMKRTNLNQALAERDAQINSLNQALTERDAQINSLNQALTERDAQINSLNQVLTERDADLASSRNHLSMIKKSTSWRMTSPIRVAKKILIEPKRTTYQLMRSLFWRLPAKLRQQLHRPRHAFVRLFRGLPTTPSNRDTNSALSDLSWAEFNKSILSRRKEYKGIFVQELVIDWNVPLYQRPQHISAALGRLGYLVIYRTDNWAGDNVNGFREVSKNVWITNRYEIEEIQGVVRSLYSTAYANSPDLLMKNGKRGALVYEYIDHIDPEISGDQENINRLLSLKNFAFSGGADFIVASARKLYDEAVDAVGKNKVILVPNGVDTVHYRDRNHHRTVLPPSLLELKSTHKAVVGYFGALAPWLWYDCIHELASARPELGFVFIGPDYYGGAVNLPKLQNVLYLGAVDYRILPAYAKEFDVCFIPFKPGDIAKTTSPLKLFEYFALEKPVIVTADMDECTAYPEVFRGNSANELSYAIDEALLVRNQESFKLRLRELADQNDWIQRARSMEVCFGDLNND